MSWENNYSVVATIYTVSRDTVLRDKNGILCEWVVTSYIDKQNSTKKLVTCGYNIVFCRNEVLTCGSEIKKTLWNSLHSFYI